MIAIWDNRLSVGDAGIDAEHRLVLNLLNELDVVFAVAAPRVVVEKALEALVRAVSRHFARDASADGPVRTHMAYQARVERLLRDWHSGELPVIDRSTLLSLGRGWIDHIGRREAYGQALPPDASANRLAV
ncbi:hypothetical protein A6A04_05955 [Paramagnetospirillum marisnigri]|uniref:Hemerythrin-like domain-containing protein n=1 Tax=Paramagnetospirillum marisnigri TaxID=1285242 RepID=A0A178MD14_9PROT|nr:hypothetical protein [Paramagnetospirillum marisnigri]OAN46652.1 hypothetical protein A6A04_05955 [Paramagnetospirillum marisnigri]